MLGLIQAQEEKLCNIAFPLCLCRLTLACISSEISTKLLGMPTHLDRSSFTGTGFTLADCSLLLSGVDCPLASPFANTFSEFLCATGLVFPYPLPVTSRSRAQAFVWFRAKTDKGIVCLADHLHSVTEDHQLMLRWKTLWIDNRSTLSHM